MLKVENNENYADLAFGMGLSTAVITREKDCKIFGYELNKTTSTLAQMLLIISGKKDYEIKNVDSTIAEIEENFFDKIAVLPPIGYKIRELDNIYQLLHDFGMPFKPSNIEILMTLKAIKNLKSSGKLVISVSPNVLFSANIMEKCFRKLLAEKYLTTVITLPSLYHGTNVATVLLVIEKSEKRKILYL